MIAQDALPVDHGHPAPTLEDVWPEVSTRLRRQLCSSGLDRSAAEDVVQEVAARVLTARPSFESAGDLLRWATVVARRLAVDEHRARRRLTADDTLERPSRVDVEAEALTRLQLDAVGRALPDLSPAHRQALTSVPVAAAERSEQVRHAVRRHRARAQLVRLVERLPVVAAVLGILGALLRRRSARRLALVAALSVPVALVPLLSHGPARPPASPPPSAPEPRVLHPTLTSAPAPAATSAPRGADRAQSDGATEATAAGHRQAPAAPSPLDAKLTLAPLNTPAAEVTSRPRGKEDEDLCVAPPVVGGRVCVTPPDVASGLSEGP